MKKITLLSLVLLGSAVLLHAADQTNTMHGWICDQRCVVQNGDQATCNTACNERSGVAVFINDRGQLSSITDQNMCKSHMNKHVMVMGTMDQQNGALTPQEIQNDETSGG